MIKLHKIMEWSLIKKSQISREMEIHDITTQQKLDELMDALKEEKELLEQKEITAARKTELNEELKKLQKIRKCVDIALENTAPAAPNVQQRKERTSVLGKLDDKKKEIAERQSKHNARNNSKYFEPEL